MRRFKLVRDVDPGGVSGTGAVAEGVQFSDETVALRWTTAYQSTAVYASIDDVVSIHGHNGATQIEWIDPDPTWADEPIPGKIIPFRGGRS